MRGGDGTSTPSSTTSAQGRKAQTYDPLRDKVRSEPGQKDHQAYRNSKGSQQLKARKTGTPPHYVYRRMHQDQTVGIISMQMTESWKSEEGDREATQSLV